MHQNALKNIKPGDDHIGMIGNSSKLVYFLCVDESSIEWLNDKSVSYRSIDFWIWLKFVLFHKRRDVSILYTSMALSLTYSDSNPSMDKLLNQL